MVRRLQTPHVFCNRVISHRLALDCDGRLLRFLDDIRANPRGFIQNTTADTLVRAPIELVQRAHGVEPARRTAKGDTFELLVTPRVDGRKTSGCRAYVDGREHPPQPLAARFADARLLLVELLACKPLIDVRLIDGRPTGVPTPGIPICHHVVDALLAMT